MTTTRTRRQDAERNAARDEILRRRPDLKGKSLEAIKRILRSEARLSLRPRRSVKSE